MDQRFCMAGANAHHTTIPNLATCYSFFSISQLYRRWNFLGMVARWYRTNKDQPLLLAGVNGAPIYLHPGITFYEVLGARSFVDQDAGEWHFHHEVP